jgi:hypothetical protein
MVETRSQQEQDLIAWASTLTKKDVDAPTAFMEQFLVTTPAETLQLPEFSGLDHEDPQNFLELCEKGLATTNPALWRDKIATRLRGSAAEWWSHNAPFAPTYEDLKRAGRSEQVRRPRDRDRTPRAVLRNQASRR